MGRTGRRGREPDTRVDAEEAGGDLNLAERVVSGSGDETQRSRPRGGQGRFPWTLLRVGYIDPSYGESEYSEAKVSFAEYVDTTRGLEVFFEEVYTAFPRTPFMSRLRLRRE